MRFFNNKLSRINFLILVGILTYLFADMSNSNGYVSAISKASPSVINITARENTNKLLRNGRSNQGVIGSGIIISDDGYIITNLHVINGKEVVEVELDDGQVYTATVVGYDQRSDLAVIKISAKEILRPIALSNSASVQIGDQVIAIGNAFGLGKTFTSGIISATGRDYGNPYLELIQTDAAINHGNSGGPLFYKDKVVGVNTQGLSKKKTEGMNFAVHFSEVNKFISLGTPKDYSEYLNWYNFFKIEKNLKN